ncbi:hypothetical protein ACHAWT_001031 [Skeletonema menzelii]
MFLPTLFVAIIALHPFSEVQAFAPPANFAAARSCSSRSSSSLAETDNEAFAMMSSSVTGNNRKAFLQSMLTAAATVVTCATLQPATAANAATTPAASFLGTYSDPINHPGGTRTITLIEGASNGDYQLAQIKGGGGRGEPKEYTLPAVIFGDRAIVIDFSPKGGPRDFAGVLESDGSIKFLRDGNRWPRL